MLYFKLQKRWDELYIRYKIISKTSQTQTENEKEQCGCGFQTATMAPNLLWKKKNKRF